MILKVSVTRFPFVLMFADALIAEKVYGFLEISPAVISELENTSLTATD